MKCKPRNAAHIPVKQLFNIKHLLALWQWILLETVVYLWSVVQKETTYTFR